MLYIHEVISCTRAITNYSELLTGWTVFYGFYLALILSARVQPYCRCRWVIVWTAVCQNWPRGI